jgi:hypothetical protein
MDHLPARSTTQVIVPFPGHNPARAKAAGHPCGRPGMASGGAPAGDLDCSAAPKTGVRGIQIHSLHHGLI